MCGRYELHTPVLALALQFDALVTHPGPWAQARYNIAPSQQVAVVRPGAAGRELGPLQWGLLPSWAKDPKSLRPTNARAETVFDKPMFRTAIRRRRCLLPADGYFEWQLTDQGKQPWRIHAADGQPLALAGLWECWERPGHPTVQSATILVTGANASLRPIHDRMPVIIRPADYARWLCPELTERADIEPLLACLDPGELVAYPVSTRVNNARHEGAELIAPLVFQGPPA